MNVSEQIINVIDDLCAKFGIAVNWTNENVWPYIQELIGKYINFEIATSAALCVLFIVLPIIAYSIAKKATAKMKAENLDWYDDEPICLGFAAAWIIFIGLLIVGIIVIINQIFDIITCLTFPEKQVFDYVMKLVNKEG